MGFLLPLIAILLLVLGGGGCALLLLPRREPARLVELFALSVTLGSGLVALTSFVCGLAVSGLALQLVVGLVCLGVAGLGGRFGACIRLRRVPLRCWCLPVLIFFTELGFLVWLGGRWVLGWDSLVVWEFKARAAFLQGGGMPLSYYLDFARQWSHPEYPLLLPLTEAWLFDWAGQADERLVRLLFSVYDAALLAGMYALGTRLGGSRWNGTLGMLMFVFVPQLLIGTGGSTSAWADALMALLYLLVAGYLVLALTRQMPEFLRPVGALCAALVWTKQEGAFLWFGLVLATAVFSTGNRLRSTAVVALPALLVVVSWRMFIQVLGVPQTPDFLPFSVSTFVSHLDRIPELLVWTSAQMTDGREWGLLWAALPVSILLADRVRLRQQVLLGALVLAPLVPDMLVFSFSAWTPYLSHVDSALPRLMEQLAALAVLTVATAAPCGQIDDRLRSMRAQQTVRRIQKAASTLAGWVHAIL